MGVLSGSDGRVRLGWRLLAFVLIMVAFGAVTAAFVPTGLVGGALALLIGSTAAGWCVLAFDGRQPAALGFHPSLSAVGELTKGTALGVAIGLAVVGVMAVLGAVSWTGQEGSAVAARGRGSQVECVPALSPRALGFDRRVAEGSHHPPRRGPARARAPRGRDTGCGDTG